MRQAFLYRGIVTASVVAGLMLAVPAFAQDSKSSAGAVELAKLMADKKLDAIAAKDPDSADGYMAALFFPGQLIVMSAKYPAPPLLNERLARREYRDIYIELNSASIADSRIFITDIGADGLRARRVKRDDPFDTRDAGGKPFKFDGSWREDKMSEADYMKHYAEADAHYTRVVELLLGEAKR